MAAGNHEMEIDTLSGGDLGRVGAKALEQVREAVAIITADLHFAWVNDEFCSLTGFERDEIVGRPVRTLRSDVHDQPFFDNIFQSVSEDGHWQGEIWRRKKTGELFPALLTISRIHDPTTDTTYYVDLFIDLDRIRSGRERLEFLVNHDALTELPNRRLFWDRLDIVIKRAERYGDSMFSLLFIDLDNFKQVNDSLGHLAGDQLLVRVAEALQGCLRDADTVARVGGDEFVILLDGDVRGEGGEALRRIWTALDEIWDGLPEEIPVGASFGLAVYPDDGHDADTLYCIADQRMYAVKGRGRDDRDRSGPPAD